MKTVFAGCSGLALVIILGLLLVAAVGCGFSATIPDIGGSIMASKVLTDSLSVPLPGATTAKIDIDTGSGNLTVDQLAGGEQLLASGTLQYLERQGLPIRSVNSSNGQATLTVRGGTAGQPWFRFPWDACNGATEWQIHLNPTVASDIMAHSGGGNVKLNLAGMMVTRLSADTGGGNLDVVLPDNTANLEVTAKTGAGAVSVEIGSGTRGSNTVIASSGAGDVVVRVPRGLAALVHATSGLGKVIMDSQFSKLDGKTYQSPDYDAAADRIEITVHSGAGNVTVTTN